MEEHFPERNIRLAASSDAIDTDEGENETAPIKSLPNERAAPLKCAAAGAERSLQRGVADALFHWQNQKGRCTRKKYDMEEINEESRGRFYKEVGIRLNGGGFSTKPPEDGLLPARWRGARLCRPSCKPRGPDEKYKLLADFNGAVLAGHPASMGSLYARRTTSTLYSPMGAGKAARQSRRSNTAGACGSRGKPS